MNVLLVNPGHDGEHFRHDAESNVASGRRTHRDPPPLGVLSVGTALRASGVDVTILDTHVEEDWRDKLVKLLTERYFDWVGLSVLIGKFMANADEITQMVRKYSPRSQVVWGGVMCSVMGREIREEYGPDMVVGGGIGRLGAPDWGMLRDRFNYEQTPYYHMIMTSVGCPYGCTFCYKHSISSKVQYRSVESVCNEMDYIHHATGGRVFAIGDDNFLTNKSRALAILAHCREKGYYLEEVIGHINSLSDELIDAMAGIVQTFIFSVETVNPRLQKLIRKSVDLEAVPEKLAKLRSVGIVANVSFMVGLPEETEADRVANWQYMERLREIHPWIRGNCYLWFPLPGTPLTDYAERVYGKPFHFPVRDYENANFWMKDKDDPYGLHFRPHLSKTEYEELFDWGVKFNETFPRVPYKDGRWFFITDEVLAGRDPCLGKPL